jgi:hypothetical protein
MKMVLPDWSTVVLLAYLIGMLTGNTLKDGAIGFKIFIVIVTALIGCGIYFVLAVIKTLVLTA